MTQSVAGKTPIPDNTWRRHTDPPSLWIAVATGSVALHFLLFWLLRLSGFSLLSQQQKNSSIPIEYVEISPKAQSKAKPHSKAKSVSLFSPSTTQRLRSTSLPKRVSQENFTAKPAPQDEDRGAIGEASAPWAIAFANKKAKDFQRDRQFVPNKPLRKTIIAQKKPLPKFQPTIKSAPIPKLEPTFSPLIPDNINPAPRFSPPIPDNRKLVTTPSPPIPDNRKLVTTPSPQIPDNRKLVTTPSPQIPDNRKLVTTPSPQIADNRKLVTTPSPQIPDNRKPAPRFSPQIPISTNTHTPEQKYPVSGTHNQPSPPSNTTNNTQATSSTDSSPLTDKQQEPLSSPSHFPQQPGGEIKVGQETSLNQKGGGIAIATWEVEPLALKKDLPDNPAIPKTTQKLLEFPSLNTESNFQPKDFRVYLQINNDIGKVISVLIDRENIPPAQRSQYQKYADEIFKDVEFTPASSNGKKPPPMTEIVLRVKINRR